MTTRDDSYFTSSGLDFRWCWYTEFWLKPTYAGGVRGKQQANAKLNLVEIFIMLQYAYGDSYAQAYSDIFNNLLSKVPLTELFEGV
jgi:hypothetical protein